MSLRPSPKRKILTQFLQLLESQPCLWDTTHSLYNNKESRDEAYELLREKYSEICEDATVDIVKRKIEHMRAVYRRENKKVIASLVSGGKQYMPQLWYYEHLAFLNKVLKTDFKPFTAVNVQAETIISDSDSYGDEPLKKKSRDNIYLKNDENDQTFECSEKGFRLEDKAQRESESFGATVGLQLSELTQRQRYLAEKLISEIIYLARVEQLSDETTVNV